jgi:hypothetical protein
MIMTSHHYAGVLLLLAAALVSSQPSPRGPAQAQAARWYKGNIHTHTANSVDGEKESPPDYVARWYQERQYNFLVFSDHNLLTDVEALNESFAAKAVPFILIPGEELSDGFSPAAGKVAQGERDLEAKQVHLGALGLAKVVMPQGGKSVADTLQRNVDAVRAAGGIPVVNHPNFLWSLTADDLITVRNAKLFELYNGHLQSNTTGGGGSPGVEELWDRVLSAGTLLYGVAADDAHYFQRVWPPPAMAAPGRGWIYVRARALTAAAILEAMERGDFYASTGVELAAYETTDKAMSITIQPKSRSRYQVLFIGRNGRVLKEVSVTPEITARKGPLNPTAPPIVYTFTGNEGYVRAKVVESNGLVAWTQPVVLRRK